jgi:hypothetical protein
MGNIYVDGNESYGGSELGTANNPYLGEVGLQYAIDNLVGGDFVYIRGTFILSASITTTNGADGGMYGPTTRIVGCGGVGSTWTVDGTQAVLDGNGGAVANCLMWQSANYWTWENTTFTDASNAGLGSITNTHAYLAFVNCHFDENTVHGIDVKSPYLSSVEFIHCSFNRNDPLNLVGGKGANSNYTNTWNFCEFLDNGGDGIELYNNCTLFGCVASVGVRFTHVNTRAYQCVFDGGTNGTYTPVNLTGIYCSRYTDHTSYGLNNNKWGVAMYNFFEDNAVDIRFPDVGARLQTTVLDVDTNVYGGEEGYEDKANNKMTLRLGAAGYRTVIPVGPLDGGASKAVFAMGLPTLPLIRPGE